MMVEAATALLLCGWRPAGFPLPAAVAALAGVIVVWTSTFGLQVPRHARLAQSFESATQQTLVAGNWIRTAAWSFRGVLLVTYLSLVFSAG